MRGQGRPSRVPGVSRRDLIARKDDQRSGGGGGGLIGFGVFKFVA
jgi:hypothetical protein